MSALPEGMCKILQGTSKSLSITRPTWFFRIKLFKMKRDQEKKLEPQHFQSNLESLGMIGACPPSLQECSGSWLWMEPLHLVGHFEIEAKNRWSVGSGSRSPIPEAVIS